MNQQDDDDFWASWYVQAPSSTGGPAPPVPPAPPTAPEPGPAAYASTSPQPQPPSQPQPHSQPRPADPNATRVDGWDPVSPVPGDAGMRPSLLGGRRPSMAALAPLRQRPKVIAAIAGAVVLLIVLVMVILPSGHPASNNTAANGSATKSSAGSAPTGADVHQAAVALAKLLGQSVTDRADVIDAVVNVHHCGPSLPKDARVFRQAADSRTRLLAKLTGMPGRSALSAPMLNDLADAWRSSASADSDLASWASDMSAGSCRRTGANDANLQASYGPDSEATTGKKAFARLWDPVANRYGLTPYQWDQL